MLEKIDLTQKLDKAEYKSIITELEWKAGEVQREARKKISPLSSYSKDGMPPARAR